MQLTLPNGMTLTGSQEQVTDAARKLGYNIGNDGVYYNSSTHGLIRITDMDTRHIRNATLKLHREWAANLSKLNDRDLIFAMRDGNKDTTFLALLREFVKRV